MSGKLKRLNFCSIATFTCAGMVVVNLLTIVALLIGMKISDATFSDQLYIFLRYLINILFYFFLTSDFIKSKNNWAYADNGIKCLLLCNYVLPPIISLFTDGILNLTSFILETVLGCGLGIAYFVLMILDNRTRGAKIGYNIALIVIGALLSAVALFTFIFEMITVVEVLVYDFSELSIYSIILYIVMIVNYFFTFLESSLYLLYAFALKRLRKTGVI